MRSVVHGYRYGILVNFAYLHPPKILRIIGGGRYGIKYGIIKGIISSLGIKLGIKLGIIFSKGRIIITPYFFKFTIRFY
jgi:hypothetical protein